MKRRKSVLSRSAEMNTFKQLEFEKRTFESVYTLFIFIAMFESKKGKTSNRSCSSFYELTQV